MRNKRQSQIGAAAIVTTLMLASVQFLVAQEPAKLDLDRQNFSRMVLHVCDADGTPIRPLVADDQLRQKFDRQGTPDVSMDGKLVAYDAWTAGADWQTARIIVVNFDGTGARNVSDGVMPSFSPDAKQMVVSRPQKTAKADGAKGQSIWVMNVDGTNKRMIADQGAWGARWSPDGKSLVFFGGMDADGTKVEKNCLRLYDFDTGKTRTVFSSQQSPFKSLVHHFDWCKTKERKVAFGGQLKRGGSASAIVNVDEGARFKLISDKETTQVAHGLSFDWHPDGLHLLVTGVQGGRTIPAWIGVSAEAEVMEFARFPDDVGARDPVVTPDGKHLIASLTAVR